MAERAGGILLQYAGSDGIIDPRKLDAVQTDIGTVVQRFFVGDNLRSVYKNEVEPLAPYPDLLNKAYVYVVASAVKAQRDAMVRDLKNAPDVLLWLAQAQPVQEILYQNPLATYDPMHTFADPRGYTLSQNIWRSSIESRAQIDALLADEIRQATSAINVSKKLTAFLKDEHKEWFTRKPYSRANYPALRLARTEISAAHGRAVIAASKSNPFVDKIAWQLSPTSHKEHDECDVNAENSPYELDKVPTYPNHPGDLCVLVPVSTQPPAQVVNSLRAMMQRGEPAPLTPVAFRPLLLAMLGAYLYNIAFREFTNLI